MTAPSGKDGGDDVQIPPGAAIKARTVHRLTKRFLAWVVVLAVGYLIVFGGSSETSLGAKKVTIDITTPQGTVRGSSVFELTRSTAPWWYPAAVTSATSIKGEVPYADLGGGHYVFMLLNDLDYSGRKAMVSYLQTNRGGDSPHGDSPIFVTFDNVEDANSIRQVDRNDLDRTFGPGYRLVSAMVTDTQERATRGTLARRFPALHSTLMEPVSKRLPPRDKMEPYRRDLRRLTWRAFEAGIGPSD